MIEAGAPSTGDCWHAFRGVPVPPGVGMVSPPTTQRNASSAQCEGRARYDGENQRGSGHYRGRSPKAPARPIRVLLAEVLYLVRRGRPDVLTGARRKVLDHTLDFRLS